MSLNELEYISPLRAAVPQRQNGCFAGSVVGVPKVFAKLPEIY